MIAGALGVLGVVGITTLISRPPVRDIPALRKSSMASPGKVVLLVLAGVALGLIGITSQNFNKFYILISLLAEMAAALGYVYLSTTLRLRWLGVMASFWVTLLLLGYIFPVFLVPLVVIGGLGAASLIAVLLKARGCALVLVALTLNDVVMWKLGLLDQIAALGSLSNDLQPLGALKLGSWILGAGDILASGLLGMWMSVYLSFKTKLLGVALQVSLMALMIGAAHLGAGPLPATLPSFLTLSVFWLLSLQKAKPKLALQA